MKLLGFTFPRQKADAASVEKSVVDSHTVTSSSALLGAWNGYFGTVREAFGGAWQRNIVVQPTQNLLTFSPVFAGVSLIAGDIAKLRLRMTERTEDGTWQEITDGATAYLPVIRKPNNFQTRAQFVSCWIISKLLYGNTYVLKERDARGVVTDLYVLDARMVTPIVTPDGDIYYRLHRDPLAKVTDADSIVPASEIIHDRMLCFWHPLVGVSPLYGCANSATQGLRIQHNSDQFFQNMSRPSGILTAPAKITDEAAERLKKHWEANYSADNIGKIAVLGDGLTYSPMTIPAQQSQLVEQMKTTIEDVARCFIPGTEVITGRGLVAIEDVVVGDEVLSHTGRWRKVEQTIKNDYVGKVVRLRAKGLGAVTATANHPFYIQRIKQNRSHRHIATEQGWIRADDLIPSQRLANGSRSRRSFDNLVMPRMRAAEVLDLDLRCFLPCPEAAEATETHVRFSKQPRATWVNRKVATDYALGWLCGLFVADGTSAGHQVEFSLTAHETEIADLLVERMQTAFGAVATMRVGHSMIRVTVSNRVINAFFKQFGTGAHNKALPQWCLEVADEFRSGVLDGLIDGDGCVANGQTKLKTASRSLAWQTRMLLWSLGLNSTLAVYAEKAYEINGKQGLSRENYSVQWQTEPAQRGAMGSSEDICFFSLDEMQESVYAGPVYNLEVEEDHSYTTVGGVAHNCLHIPLHMLQAGTSSHMGASVGEINQLYFSQALQALINDLEDCMTEGIGLTPWQRSVEFDLSDLQRLDPLARAETSAKAIGSGYMTPNEARAKEGLPPIEGGDSGYLQVQNYSLAALAERDNNQPFAKPAAGVSGPTGPAGPGSPAGPPEVQPPLPKQDAADAAAQARDLIASLRKGLLDV